MTYPHNLRDRQDNEMARGPELITCVDCDKKIQDVAYATMDGATCEDCYDARPWYSVCCGHNPCGVELDMGLCGDCHDHCEYEK